MRHRFQVSTIGPILTKLEQGVGQSKYFGLYQFKILPWYNLCRFFFLAESICQFSILNESLVGITKKCTVSESNRCLQWWRNWNAFLVMSVICFMFACGNFSSWKIGKAPKTEFSSLSHYSYKQRLFPFGLREKLKRERGEKGERKKRQSTETERIEKRERYSTKIESQLLCGFLGESGESR